MQNYYYLVPETVRFRPNLTWIIDGFADVRIGFSWPPSHILPTPLRKRTPFMVGLKLNRWLCTFDWEFGELNECTYKQNYNKFTTSVKYGWCLRLVLYYMTLINFNKIDQYWHDIAILPILLNRLSVTYVSHLGFRNEPHAYRAYIDGWNLLEKWAEIVK